MPRPRVIIADDHQLVAAALKELLASECEIVATVYDGDSLMRGVVSFEPEIVLLDLSMPQGGLGVCFRLRELNPDIRTIVVTMNEDRDVAAEALRLGASAYVLKSCAASELGEALRHVMRQEVYVTPRVAGGIIDLLIKSPKSDATHRLSRRQHDVLRLLAEGKSMKQAAAELNLAVATVSFHKYRMMRQLNIKSSAELIRFAVTHHIV